MTAQPRPTAADVLREHEYTWHEGPGAGFRCPCGTWVAGSLWDHLADMLAAAGLLATAEHDAQVRREAIAEVWNDAHEAIRATEKQHQDVAAKALRDAADALGKSTAPGLRHATTWLRARADRIAAGYTP
jgi:hypothetical protein